MRCRSQCRLTHQALAQLELGLQVLARTIGVRRQQVQHRLSVRRLIQAENTVLDANQRRQLRKDHASNGLQIGLAHQHGGKASQVGFQPVLLGVLLRRVAQIANHLVDVVFEQLHFTLRVDLDGARQVALGDGRGDLADGAQLRGQAGGQLIDVVGQVPPGTRGAGHARLAAELAFDADFTSHRRYLVGKDGQRFDHVVDRFAQRGDLAARDHVEGPLQVAVGNGGHHPSDAADLFGEVARRAG